MTPETEAELDELSAVAEEVLGDLCTDERLAAVEGGLDAELWAALGSLGFTLLGTPEEVGGSGGELAHLAVLVRLAASRGAQVPLAEHALAARLLSRAGLPLPAGTLTLAGDVVAAMPAPTGWHLAGAVARVPYASQTAAMVGVARSGTSEVVYAVPLTDAQISPGRNLAAEPRDTVHLDTDVTVAVPAPAGTADLLGRWQRVARAAMIAGACDRAVAMTVQHATERRQFGRPIALFQAVQQHVAGMAVEASAVRAAVEAAVALAEVDAEGLELASHACTVAATRAARTVAASAHQVHGAMGFAHEHPLRMVTARLWAWRDEWGHEPTSVERLGVLATDHADDLWAMVVDA